MRQQPALAATSKSGGVAAATRPIFASSASGQVRSPHLCAFHCINWPRHECSLGRRSPPSRPPFHPQMRCSPSPCCSPTGVAAAALPTRKTHAHSRTNHPCHDWLASTGRAKARNAQHTRRLSRRGIMFAGNGSRSVPIAQPNRAGRCPHVRAA